VRRLLLVATKLFGAFAGILTVILSALPFVLLWFAMPLRRRRNWTRPANWKRPLGVAG
jgi:hypothetical protein